MNPYNFLIKLIIVTFTASLLSVALGQEDDSTETWGPINILGDFIDKTHILGDFIDKTHTTMSKGVLSTGNWLDSFFSDERSETEASKTRLKINLSAFSEEGEGVEFDSRVNLRLRFPRFSKRLQVEVSGNPKDDQATPLGNTQEQNAVERFEGANEQNISAALRYFIASTKQFNISFQGGFRLRDGNPVLFAGPRYRQTIEAGDWDIRLKQLIRWFTDNGFESQSRIDFERPLTEKLFFRASTGGSWFEDEEDNFFYDARFFIFQPLSRKRTLVYELNNFFEIQPNNHMEEVNLRLRYRQQIWRKWLFFEVAPQISFPKDRDFEDTLGLLFKLEMLFGGEYM